MQQPHTRTVTALECGYHPVEPINGGNDFHGKGLPFWKSLLPCVRSSIQDSAEAAGLVLPVRQSPFGLRPWPCEDADCAHEPDLAGSLGLWG